MFGDWFGRPYDNFHQPKGFMFSDGVLTITFNEDETLTIWNPASILIDERTLLVRNADHVRWEWFYYGRLKLKENRFYMDYVRTPNGIKGCSNVDWYAHTFKTSESEPAVRIE